MNWVKTNYDQAILAFFALVLLGVSGWIINNAMHFQDMFAAIQEKVVPNNSIPPIDLSNIDSAKNQVANPTLWNMNEDEGSIFISEPYIAKGDTLINPKKDPNPIHPPVPNKWIIENHLDILDGNVLNEDPDGDGFTNLDEWMGTKGDGSDASNPNDKASHPPYYTKLKLAQYIRQPFRLLFASYDGTQAKLAEMDFQINTLDVNQPSQFVHVGDMIAGTKFKVMGFALKNKHDTSTDSDIDVSELTVQNTETGDNVVLVLNETANSPDSYAQFNYLWGSPENFSVKKGKEFALPPETTLRYILIDITDDNAVIQTPDKKQVTIQKQK
jgi:hypothetical protein